MSVPDGASQAAQARIMQELSRAQAPRGGAAEREVNVEDVRREGSKDVQKVRQAQFRSRHGLLMGFFGLVMYVIICN